MPFLEICEATVIKGDRPILDRLSLTVRRNEHTAILGPNGSGKTALIKLISRQHYALAPDNGKPPVLIFGRESGDVFELRARLGIVSADLQHSFTSRAVPGGTRGRDVVLSGFFAGRSLYAHQRLTPAMQARAQAALELMEAAHLADRPIEELSTGEARRLLIARALVPDPPALLLDEPTTGLDLAARERFLHTLEWLAGLGKTLILVTHRVEEIIPAIDRVALLSRGRVVLAGAKSEVLTADNLSNLFGVRVRLQESQGWYQVGLKGSE
jgi:iron complex transport system ATP-binding protein